MNDADKLEGAKTFLRSVPRKVRFASVLVCAVGLLILARFCLTAWAGKLATGKAVFYGLLIFALLLLNGCALIRKSKTGYVVVVVVVLLPILGLAAQSLHFVVLMISSSLSADKLGALICGINLAQLVVTCGLFFFLFSREVRLYVWR